MNNEGYIKFKANWTEAPAFSVELLNEILLARKIVHDKGLIGEYAPGIGFGNISQRYGGNNQFLISGSKTGCFAEASPEHFTHITKVYPERNEVYCVGPVIASSETMSHAMIYQCNPEARVAIHVHHAEGWKRLLHQVPTTDASAEYGSPEMSASIQDLFQTTNLQSQKIFVMEGHPEGIFVFGQSFQEAITVLEKHGL